MAANEAGYIREQPPMLALNWKTVGIYLFGLASAAAGLFNLIWGDFEAAHQPVKGLGDNIPYLTVLVYLVSSLLVVAGLGVLWRQTARPSALALTAVYFFFAICWMPRFVTAPRIIGYSVPVWIGLFGGLAEQLVLIAGGLLAYTSPNLNAEALRGYALPAARWVIGICAIDFGLFHLTSTAMTASMVPKWIPPGANFWVVLTGIAFILAGLAILTRILDVLAARMLAIMLLVFSALALIPRIPASPRDHITWGSNAYNLTVVGAVLILAASLAAWRASGRGAANLQSLE